MGQSTNAILAFGIDLGEEWPDTFVEDDEDEGFDADHFLACDFAIEVPEWAPGASSEYWQAKREAIAKIPLEIIEHCSDEYPMYFLAIRGTQHLAHRGYPREVTMRPIEQSETEAMRAFCEKHGIEWKEPKWQIFSMWN